MKRFIAIFFTFAVITLCCLKVKNSSSLMNIEIKESDEKIINNKEFQSSIGKIVEYEINKSKDEMPIAPNSEIYEIAYEEESETRYLASQEFAQEFKYDMSPEQREDALKLLESQVRNDELVIDALRESEDIDSVLELEDRLTLNKIQYDHLKEISIEQ